MECTISESPMWKHLEKWYLDSPSKSFLSRLFSTAPHNPIRSMDILLAGARRFLEMTGFLLAAQAPCTLSDPSLKITKEGSPTTLVGWTNPSNLMLLTFSSIQVLSLIILAASEYFPWSISAVFLKATSGDGFRRSIAKRNPLHYVSVWLFPGVYVSPEEAMHLLFHHFPYVTGQRSLNRITTPARLFRRSGPLVQYSFSTWPI